ncbi:YhjD/YihY/BrkB family envelope integrity protein [Halomicronema sp. CCY15110]|uniref:YhjD/YihY/BrkB family envelope integrity protein n=1 Tax=Halomicronema sp. CCY15110 TaxID=2767773 RepID=UPI001950F1F1|nr:YhjD/YihY/BrkB family envelope integrity protein [Halomicronema sp. CCY15110]
MSLPPSRPYPPDGSSSQFLLPPATPPPTKRTVGSYLNYPLWKNLGQQAARHRYWMKGAAIAYGIVCCCLLSSFMAIAAASLWAAVAQGLANGLQRWVPAVVAPMQTVIADMSADWPLNRRWWLFLLTAGASLALWCKVVGLTQQIIRSDGDLASHLIPTLRQRSLTGLVAIATAALTLLAVGVVLLALPVGVQQLAEVSVIGLIRQWLVQSLRWSLAASTIALSYGVLYRSSQKSSARSVPVLPGTVFATVIWLATAMAFKHHLESLADYHWLFSAASTLTLALIGLYICTLGLLLGGQYNKLINRYFPPGRSPQSSPQGPPPSFESFTIPKQRPYR